MQAHPGLTADHPTLAFRDFQLLKLKYDKLLSNFAFKCNLRHYIKAKADGSDAMKTSVATAFQDEGVTVVVTAAGKAQDAPVPAPKVGRCSLSLP